MFEHPTSFLEKRKKRNPPIKDRKKKEKARQIKNTSIYMYIYTTVADIYEEYYERGGSRPYVPIQDLREAG